MSEAAPSLPSLSQRLMEFAGEDLNAIVEEREYIAQLHLIITAWNLSIAPGHPKLTQRFDNAVLQSPPEIRVLAEARIADLVERKKKLFPDDTRVIIDARLRKTPTGVALETKSYDYTVHGDKGL
ncbi:MAG: hypothetical protein SFV32_04235 [Opitutaceae bacterium]|nr:hypothetical protein [Opitutaceae bacterium]